MRYPPKFVILDQDEVTFQPWDGLDDTIDECFTDAIARALNARNVVMKRADIKALVQQSYAETGVATTLFARRHAVDETAVMRDYHRQLLDDHVLPQFAEKSAPFAAFYTELRQYMHTAVQNGVRFGILTHGDSRWAAELAPLTGIADLVPFRRGIDAYGLRRKNKDHSLYHDFLREAGYFGMYENVVLIDDRLDNLEKAAAMGIRGIWVSAANGLGPESTLRAMRDIVRETAAYNRQRTVEPLVRLTA